MKCPRCGSAMQEGRLRFQDRNAFFGRRDALGQFVFLPDDGEDVVLNLAAVSHYCRSCETVVAPGLFEKLKCFECGRDIEEGADSCSDCGWTWK